ncbi:MarR family winged helix-turn-helix transcriptional regulator [Nocardioides okcheonensis]|uniref:MarR family winged helix-turn-helix transcriptional regulator n=1 Tax=Nocardioides okcheonensis TaxID=2894081 RepID=UPI0022A6AFEA|nr:MarR family transcriptional regulator [Nocardioides okcheonensis]
MTPEDVPHDPLSTALQRVLLAHTRAQGHLARTLGVSRTDVDALEHLMVGPLSAVELAGRLGISQGAVTHLLRRLEKRDHARRTSDPEDRRRVAIELTDTGRDTVVAHVLPLLRDLDALAARMSRRSGEAVIAYLDGSTTALLALAGAEVPPAP